ncbi:NAD(P)-binding domain [Penicillium digitatum]|uniref:NAD-dependent epimerase/dehydratase domain-containing protein n=3 Tax=Penicillium digitatum TaxID=36651 RepID=K9FBX9_PEND2|nr:hypothetical protein PDIP_46790 [Penicillium digitatum Pd1]EKV06860.1 hypothetical protein PDIG_76330 [Penicillium digitatum PHI26]EKV13824.1 hypothetical protein PDIP_46790 [Penicillium digitatum Pd1]KAG0160796.1 hypothetical protein PDIDSM_8326 [Penicillium digitatum]QQK46334.1 NAD(P)-binding domain [Penicillium digitatum]
MKLIVAGATGLVGTEIIRQCLQNSEITQVIALARKPVYIEDGIDPTSKLKSVVIRDYGEYSADVKAEFAGADACIWTVAVTPFRTSSFDFAEVKRVCQDCTLAGFKAMYEAGPAKPFRFIYFSADGTPRDPTKKPAIMGDYQVMRCETELMVINFPTEYPGVDICIAQPGVVVNSTSFGRSVLASVFRIVNIFTRAIPNIHREELSAAVLDLAVKGLDQETVKNNDLVRRGQAVLKRKAGSKR